MKTVFLIIAAFIAGMFFASRCTPGAGPCPAGDTLSWKVDTTWNQDTSTTEPYGPEPDFIEGGRIPDQVDTPKVIRKHFEKPVYLDTVRTVYGFVIIHDTLQENRILSRQVFTDMKLPVITNTITVREKPRNQAFLGLNGQWTPATRMPAIGPSLMLLTKRGRVYEAGALLNEWGKWTFQGSLKFPLGRKR